MSKALSIVVTTLDDVRLSATIQSLRDTATDNIDVVIVNDAGSPPYFDQEYGALTIRVINNSHRVGVGPSRHIGLLHAKGDYVLICDSHMAFQHGWQDKVMARLKDRNKTLMCFTCLGLDSNHLDVNNPKSKYYGATWNIFGKDNNAPLRTQVMEAVWNKGELADDSELPCVMGGAYAAARDWFLQISSLNLLRYWGEDESVLSLRSWLFGGSVRIMTSVGIGHVFNLPHERQPFTVPPGYTLHNKLLVLYTLLPHDLRSFLIEKLQFTNGGGELSTAKKLIEANWHLIEAEMAVVKTQSVMDFYSLMSKLNIPLPI